MTINLKQWQDLVSSLHVEQECTSLSEDFFGCAVRHAPDSSRLCTLISTGQTLERTADIIRRDPKELVMMLVQRKGTAVAEQNDRQCRLTPDQFSLCDSTRPFRIRFDGPFEMDVFKLPRRLMDQRLSDVARFTGCAFGGQHAPASVATSFIRSLAEYGRQLKDEGYEMYETFVADLVATAVLSEQGAAGSVDLARYAGLLSRLRKLVRDTAPDLEEFARGERLSVRSLQRVFQAHGTTPRRWILDQRLAGVAEDLQRRTAESRSITEIAFSWGFNDLAHFNRSFHVRFACSPSEWRRRSNPSEVD